MSESLDVRVRVLDAWDDILMHLPAATSIADVKRRALEAARVSGSADDFLVKFRGAEVRDETRSLGEERVPEHGPLIVMRRRRAPVL